GFYPPVYIFYAHRLGFPIVILFQLLIFLLHSRICYTYSIIRNLEEYLLFFLAHFQKDPVILILTADSVAKIIFYNRLQDKFDHFDSQQFYRTVNLICKNSIISIFKQLQILFAVVQLLADSDPVSIFQLAPEQNRHAVKHLSYISVTIADSLHSDSFKSIVQKMRIRSEERRVGKDGRARM